VYPKKKVTYCKKCKSHTTFKLFEYKPGTPRLLAQGKLRKNREKKI
jgi:ribosomal protein L44E